MKHQITFSQENKSILVPDGKTILQAQILAGLRPDSPCGGKGICGKCRVLVDGHEILACQEEIHRDMTVITRAEKDLRILATGWSVKTKPDSTDDYVMAFDIGTTTVVAYLLDGHTGTVLSQHSCVNPQIQYGADVISRIQHAIMNGGETLSCSIRNAMKQLAEAACKDTGISVGDITVVSIVGNTAMHHLLLNINPTALTTPPYMPEVFDSMVLGETCKIRVLPNIAGFVGGDTVSCMVSTRFDKYDEPTLIIDIGTNGEMVLGNKNRRIACSTAAGPAFEGARISCGMHGAKGAIDHVWVHKGMIQYSVIGDTSPEGICGSGLLDLVAVLLDLGIIDETGWMENKEFQLCERVVLTQRDVREVQLAKAAIRAGIELLAQTMSIAIEDIHNVFLAGAFGNYLTPSSACRIGMIPNSLLDRIVPIGNAAGEGAKLCALSEEDFRYSQSLAKETEFLELASLPQFQACFVDSLEF